MYPASRNFPYTPQRLKSFTAMVLCASIAFVCNMNLATAASDTPAIKVDPLPTPFAPKAASDAAKRAVTNPHSDTKFQTKVQLGIVAPVEKKRLNAGQDHEKALRIGFGRDMPQTYQTQIDWSSFKWEQVAGGGQRTVLSINSSQAAAMRVGLSIDAAPAGVELRFFSSSHPGILFGPYLAAEQIMQQQHVQKHSTSSKPIFWSPVVEGDEISVGISLPAGVQPAQVLMSVPSVSHLYRSIEKLNDKSTNQVGDSLSCEKDVVCKLPEWGDVSSSVAKIIFTEAGSSFLCTGTLLNNVAQDYTPYFLTANHCISDSAAAATVNTYWFFQSSACNSNTLSSSYKHLTGGASLLAASTDTDFSFMRLREAPPAGATYAGWQVQPLNTGTSASSVHHPMGDLAKLTSYVFSQYRSWNDASGTPSQANSHIETLLSNGVTESGSSGAGLWVTDSNNIKRLVGQLHGGSDATCQNPNGHDLYGRFDFTYQKISSWLNPTAQYVVEFYNSNLDHYFITADAAEATQIDQGSAGPGWSRTGQSFKSGGSAPVCRFYGSMSPGPNSHFYTVNTDECSGLKDLQASTPASQKRWNFESLDFYASPPANKTCLSGLVPVYRAYNNGFALGKDSNHRIARDIGAINQVVARGWIDEGIVMCAPQ
ncbi:MAG: trypsin-like peptidase domain-containing protein [Pseudomonadota bacterium]